MAVVPRSIPEIRDIVKGESSVQRWRAPVRIVRTPVPVNNIEMFNCPLNWSERRKVSSGSSSPSLAPPPLSVLSPALRVDEAAIGLGAYFGHREQSFRCIVNTCAACCVARPNLNSSVHDGSIIFLIAGDFWLFFRNGGMGAARFFSSFWREELSRGPWNKRAATFAARLCRESPLTARSNPTLRAAAGGMVFHPAGGCHVANVGCGARPHGLALTLPVLSLVDFSVFPDGAVTRRSARSGDGAA